MVNHKERYIFIHVPRTAGHSIYEALDIDVTSRSWPLHLPRSDYKENYISFGFIRNPWERMYSCYCRQKDYGSYYGKSFKYYLLEGIKGKSISLPAMYYLSGCDYIGRVENIQNDFNQIMQAIGKQPMVLNHLNKYVNSKYQDYYDDEMIAYIAQKHKDDIEYGNYVY